MTKEQTQVHEFMRAFQQSTPVAPRDSSEVDFNLRFNLIDEEFGELVTACNLTDVADAIADLLYVVYGTAVAYGIDIEPIFQLVHENNMKKLWSEDQINNICGNWYYNHVYTDEKTFVRYYLVHDENGKVMKSPTHVDIKPMIAGELCKQGAPRDAV